MPNNDSMPNMLMANWIRNFNANHPQRSVPKPDPDYKLKNVYNSKISTLIDKSPKSDENTLILTGIFDCQQIYTNSIKVVHVNNFGLKTNITDFTFDFDNNVMLINLDKSYYNYQQIRIVITFNEEYSGVKLTEQYTCFYNKYYKPVEPIE